MSARTYRRKPYDVRAIQWNGNNAAELAEFTGGDFEPDESPYDKSATGYLFTGESYDQKGRYFHTGDWIVGPRPFQVWTDEYFQNAFELVEDTDETGDGS